MLKFITVTLVMTLLLLFSHNKPSFKAVQTLACTSTGIIALLVQRLLLKYSGNITDAMDVVVSVIWHRDAIFSSPFASLLKMLKLNLRGCLSLSFFHPSIHSFLLLAQRLCLDLSFQSQCSCRSCESRKSVGIPSGVRAPAEPGGMVRSSHSILSRPGSDRPMLSEEGGEEESQKDRSDVSMGENGCWSISCACSSSIRPCVRGSDADGVPASVTSRKASSWLSAASGERLGRLWLMAGLKVGGGATWICGGGLEKAVLTGRVVMFAVTGRVLVRDTEGSCWINGVISAQEG